MENIRFLVCFLGAFVRQLFRQPLPSGSGSTSLVYNPPPYSLYRGHAPLYLTAVLLVQGGVAVQGEGVRGAGILGDHKEGAAQHGRPAATARRGWGRRSPRPCRRGWSRRSPRPHRRDGNLRGGG